MDEIKKSKAELNDKLQPNLPELRDSFQATDNKIDTLIFQSSEDFKKLSSYFKPLFKDLRGLSALLKQFIEKGQLFDGNQLNTLYQRLRSKDNPLLTYNYAANRVAELLKSAGSEVNNTLIEIKNHHQNITSFKLFISQFSYIDASTKTKLNKDIDKLRSHALIIEKQLLEINQKLKKLNSAYDYNVYMGNIQLIEPLNQLKNMKDVFGEATEYFDKESSQIITQLQYQDILNQRIEHIHHVHAEIIQDISQWCNSDYVPMNIRVKLLMRIKDVAGLQAAQLFYVNKQYQGALSEIIKIYKHLVHEIDRIYHLLDADSSEFAFKSLDTFISQLAFLKDKTENWNDFFRQYGMALRDIPMLFENNRIEIEKYFEEYNVFVKTIENTAKSLKNDKNEDYYQLNILLSEASKNYSVVNSLTLNTTQNISDLENIIQNPDGFKKSNPLQEDLKVFSDYISEYENIKEMLNEGNKLIHELHKNTVNSIENVEYYDIFEKKCDEIIEELNVINMNINIGIDKDNKESKEENLDMIKQKYTMESERLVHEMVIKSKVNSMSETQTIDSEDINAQENNGELELF